MLLRQLVLSNVGLYQGEQGLAFSTDQSRPVTLVGGRNGTGKTTLLNAIPLVLYGNRARAVLGASAYPEYLQALIHKGETRASVSLEFDRREGGRTVRYLIEREWARAANGRPSDTLYVSVDEKPRPDLEANWPEFVEGVMPLSVSGLAIFDGEKIEALADVSSAAEVLRTSLYGLLGLDLVERLQRDLADYRRRVAHATAHDHVGLRNALTQAEDRLAVALVDLDARRGEVEECERIESLAAIELGAARDHLAEEGGGVFARREDLHAALVAAEVQITGSERRLESLVGGALPLLLVESLLEKVAGMGERRREGAEAALLLDRMKERDERLLLQLQNATTAFPDESVAALEALLAADRRVYEVDYQVSFDVSDIATQHARDLLGGAGVQLRDEASELAHDILTASAVVESTRRSLDSVPTGEAIEATVRAVASAEARLTAAQALLAAARERSEDGERKVVAAQREVDRLATEVLEAGAGESDAIRVARELDRAEITLEAFSSRVVERHIGRIGDAITQSLRALLRKETLVTRIAIEPKTLALSLYGRDGDPVDSRRLSAGERQMLATAVLWGLSKSTGRPLPTIIDTPVGRLDRSHRTNLVTRYFPAAARQVVLLSTDEEIVGDYLGLLSDHIGREHLLDHDEDLDRTCIIDGYFE